MKVFFFFVDARMEAEARDVKTIRCNTAEDCKKMNLCWQCQFPWHCYCGDDHRCSCWIKELGEAVLSGHLPSQKPS